MQSGLSRRERRAWAVAVLATMTMLVEFVAGRVAHSLALIAEGWHMASHAGVLGFAGFAYWYARKHAARDHFAFGTGKVFALAGYTNAVTLLLAGLLLVVEAVPRFAHPEPIDFAGAWPVAVGGLLVNLASMALLGGEHHLPDKRHPHAGGDHNLRAAYLHLLADTLTSALAVLALVAGRTTGLRVFDPVAGFLGGILMGYWGAGLLRSSARQLLDAVPLSGAKSAIRERLEALGVGVRDVRVWQTGPGELGCIASIVASGANDSQASAALAEYRAAVLDVAPVAHLAIEVSSRGSAS